ncbi:MAG TPA: hypothetical protein V6C85_11260 [Allocoleopsis sp.]
MLELEDALKFIEKVERQNAGKSGYEIANILRGYTKRSYTSEFWSAATGYKQGYIEGEFQGKLNIDNIRLSGEPTDFGHFIAALSDQINCPGIHLSDLTSWTADHTSWAGDIASAIIAFYSDQGNTQFINLEDAFNKLASDSDYTADIAAYVVGEAINSGRNTSVSKEIYRYNTIPYSENVRTFIKKRFRGRIEGNFLNNPTEVEAEIRRAVSTYIRLYPTSNLFKSVKDLLKLQPKLEWENPLLPSGADLLKGSLHFLHHVVEKGGLEDLKFKPYQMPGLPWLGTVSYDVSVSRANMS